MPPGALQDNHVSCVKMWALMGRIEGGPERASYELWREDEQWSQGHRGAILKQMAASNSR